MIYCRFCGGEMNETAKFCGRCGQGTENIKENQNKEILDDSKEFAKPPKSVLKYILVPFLMVFLLVSLWGLVGFLQSTSGSTSGLFSAINILMPFLLLISTLALFIAPFYAVYSNSKNFDGTIKCGNCDYIGPGEPARKLGFNILAWLCVLIAWPITVIYFLTTSKYRCPKCKSTFLGMRTKGGVFVGRGGGSRVLAIVLIVFLSIAFIGILSSVVLASLSTAREKARDAMVISNIAQLQLGTELFYDKNNTSYSYAEDCQSGMFADADMQPIIAELASSNVRCFATGDSYSVSASLEREEKSYCVDQKDRYKGLSAGIVGGIAKCTSSEGGLLSGVWQEYNSLVGSFSALFPSTPSHETQNDEIGSDAPLVTEIYSSSDKDTAYFVAYINYPTSFELDTPNNVLENVVSGMVANDTSNILVSVEKTTVQNSPAIKFLIKNKKEEIYLKGNAILKDRDLYLVYNAYPTGLYSEANYSKFMNSFEMK